MSRYARLLASLVASIPMCALCLGMVACSGGVTGVAASRLASSASTRAVAVAPGVDEARVLAALSTMGIDDALSATRVMVPLSDFSRVVDAPLDSALRRACDADPRRTPFIAELASRFTTTGPDGSVWTVLYLPDPTAERDAVAAMALSSLGVAWAWDARSGGRSSPFLWIPAAAFALWLVLRKPRRGALARLVVALAFSPILMPGAMCASTLFVALAAGFAVANGVAAGAPARGRDRSLAILKETWPYGLAVAASVAAIVVLERSSLPYLAASCLLAALCFLVYPRLAKAISSRRLHEAPRFVALTRSRTTAHARAVVKAMAAPVLAMIALYPFSSTRDPRSSDQPLGPAYALTRAYGGTEAGTDAGADAEALLAEHLAYQEALTYGRIGDAAWGQSRYDPAYRYADEGGRMVRAPGQGPASASSPGQAYAEALAALRERGPSSILPASNKKAR